MNETTEVNMPSYEDQEIRRAVYVAEARARAAAEPAIRATLAAELPKVKLPFDLRESGAKWDDTTGAACLWLVPKDLFDEIPDGSPMVSITPDVKIKGLDDIDQDTRGGLLAWGFLDAQLAES